MDLFDVAQLVITMMVGYAAVLLVLMLMSIPADEMMLVMTITIFQMIFQMTFFLVLKDEKQQMGLIVAMLVTEILILNVTKMTKMKKIIVVVMMMGMLVIIQLFFMKAEKQQQEEEEMKKKERMKEKERNKGKEKDIKELPAPLQGNVKDFSSRLNGINIGSPTTNLYMSFDRHAERRIKERQDKEFLEYYNRDFMGADQNY